MVGGLVVPHISVTFGGGKCRASALTELGCSGDFDLGQCVDCHIDRLVGCGGAIVNRRGGKHGVRGVLCRGDSDGVACGIIAPAVGHITIAAADRGGERRAFALAEGGVAADRNCAGHWCVDGHVNRRGHGALSYRVGDSERVQAVHLLTGIFKNGVLCLGNESVGTCPGENCAFRFRFSSKHKVIACTRGVGGRCSIHSAVLCIHSRCNGIGAAVRVLNGNSISACWQIAVERIVLEIPVVERECAVVAVVNHDKDAAVGFGAAGIGCHIEYRGGRPC